MTRQGTLIICVQNLDCSGANQVVLNIVDGRAHPGNVLVLSPKPGAFAARYVESGAAVRVGESLSSVLAHVRDVFCVLCNTVMTADTVLSVKTSTAHPVVWILHEWWDESMLQEQLAMRNVTSLTPQTVRDALGCADRVVCVCEAQRELYKPTAQCEVITVGVPDPWSSTHTGTDAPHCSHAFSLTTASSSLTLAQTPLERSRSSSLTSSLACPSYCPSMLPSPPNGPTNGSLSGFGTAGFPSFAPLSLSSLSTPTQSAPSYGMKRPFVFLCLGIICPRKNQLLTISLFQEFCARHSLSAAEVRLKIVGARRTRSYEIAYLETVQAVAAQDPRIEVHDVTSDAASLYLSADAVVLTSVNEVTPMVISEALSFSLPVLSTNIAGIPEMFTDEKEGFLFAPEDRARGVWAMERLFFQGESERELMRRRARERYEEMFTLSAMTQKYRSLFRSLSPAVVLVDMDGVVVDWDRGFTQRWKKRFAKNEAEAEGEGEGEGEDTGIDRSRSYYMEDCVAPALRGEAIALYLEQGFFLSLPPMVGAVNALHEMEREGLDVYLCTAPILESRYCVQEKVEWVRAQLGDRWLHKLVLCDDKTMVKGDVLIDDKPFDTIAPSGRHTTATWKPLLFDAPYNRTHEGPRMSDWKDWRACVYPLLGEEVKEPLNKSLSRCFSSSLLKESEEIDSKEIAIMSVAELMSIEEQVIEDPVNQERTKTWRQHQLRVAAAQDNKDLKTSIKSWKLNKTVSSP